MAHKRTTTGSEKPARAASRKTSHAHATRHPKPRTAAPDAESLFEPDDPTGRAAMSYWSGPREHGDGGSQLDARGGHVGFSHGELQTTTPEPDRHDGAERDR